MAIRSEESFSNFVTWAVRAMEHTRGGHAEDALANLRKAGEAAAKTIIAHRWAGKRANEAIAGARLVDMTDTIVRAKLAPEGTTLLLRTLRVEGNTGVHDERVRQGRVKLGVTALEELAKWLCNDLLGRAMPAELRAAFDQERIRHTPPPTSQKDPAQDERMAGIEAALRDLSRRTEHQPDSADPAVIAAINALHARLDAMERPQQEVSPTTEALVPEASMRTGRGSWKIVAAIAVLLMLSGVVWWSMRGDAKDVAVDTGRAVAYDPGALNVLLLPLTVVQDDPNLRLDLPAAMANRLQKRIGEFPWMAHVVIDTVQRSVTPTYKEAWAIGQHYGATLVIFGDLLEPTVADSGRVVLSYVMGDTDGVQAGEFRSQGFRTMADAAVQRTLDASVWWFDLALAERLVGQGAFSQALRVLQQAATANSVQETTRRMLLAQNYAATGNNDAALREALWCREQGVDHAGIHAFLARIFASLGDPASAMAEAERAVKKEPHNAMNILLLASLLAEPEAPASANSQRADRLVDRALAIDSTLALAWAYKAASLAGRSNWGEAKDSYERSLALDPADHKVKVQLANLLVQYSDLPERGLRLVNEVIAATDSNHVQALELAANIYTHTTMAQPRAALQVLGRLERLQAGDHTSILLNQGMAALMAGQGERAVALLEQCWRMDSTHVRTAEAYALALMNKGQYEQGARVALAGLAIDSLDSRLNMHMGELFRFGPADMRNDRMADQYLTRALLTDARDPYILNLAGEVRLGLGNIRGAASAFNAAYELVPDDHRTNRNMGNLKQAQDQHRDAIPYFRRALALDPQDNETASNLAYSLWLGGPEHAQEGLKWSQRSVDLARSPENLVIHAHLLWVNKRPVEAEQAYFEAVAQRSDLRQQDLEEAFGTR